MTVALILFGSYLLGAVPTSLIAGRMLRGRSFDIRQHGSGNAGATNVYRVLGWKAGLAVVFIDIAKGYLAAGPLAGIDGAPLLFGDPLALPVLAGIAAVLGHCFSIFTGCRGGKGVATAGGLLFAVAPLGFLGGLAVLVAVIVASGYVSAASLAAAFSLPVLLLLWPAENGTASPALYAIALAVPLFVAVTHRANIARLRKGEESRFEAVRVFHRLGR